MANESKLIKDFKHSDVQRMRNIISKKTNDRTTTQIGYTKGYIEHKEGDIFEENGKQWTIKNGLKQTITRFDVIKQKLYTPLTCPKCHQPMSKGHIDKYMYSIHKTCSDCVFINETKLKHEGKYEEYSQNIIKQGISFHINEMENILFELLMDQHGESFVTEAGDIEEWKGNNTNNNKLVEDIQEYIEKLKLVVEP